MNAKKRLEDGLKDAMRSGDSVRKSTLRMALTSIHLAEVDTGRALEEQEIVTILQKEVKSRQEAIEEAERANRPELKTEAEAEISVLEDYLPRQLTPQELEALAREVIAEVGASNPNDMGKVMKELTPRLQGRATGGQASQVVRSLLSG